jgi:hypothetical protein
VSASPAASFAPVEALAVTGDGRSYDLGGQIVKPRANRVLKRALELDADGDDRADLVAWTEASDGRKGELSFFHGGEAAAEYALAALPKDLDIDRCSLETRLVRVAPAVVALAVDATCTAPDLPEQWIAAVRLDAARTKSSPRPPELRLEVRARAPLQVSITGADRDRDGHDDLELAARLREAPQPHASLFLLDRPAGYAIDPAEPEASLLKAAESLATRSKSGDVRAEAARLLDLSAAVCEGFGSGALKTSSGAARCGDARFVADAVFASGASCAAASDLGCALAASEVLAGLKNDGGRRAALDALIDPKLPRVGAVVRPVSARPAAARAVLSPLAFDGAGKLLVDTAAGVVEVDPESGEEKGSEAISWPRTVAWQSGDTTVDILGAATSCDPGERRVLARARQAKTHAVLPSALARVPSALLRTPCKPETPPLTALVVDGSGVTVAVGPEVFRLAFTDQGLVAAPAAALSAGQAFSPPGSARAADGSAAVLTLADGLWVQRPSGAQRWVGPDTKGLFGCVPRAGGDRVACLSAQGAVVVSPL